MVTYVSETTTRLDRRHDDLVARVEGEVAGRLEMLVAGLDEQSETLRSVRSDTEDRLDAVGASISRVDERLVAVDERFGMLDGRLGGVDERIDLADGRLEAVGASIGRVDERLVAVDERLVAVDERFGMLDGRLGGVDDRIDLADGRFVDVEAQLVAHGERVGTIDERLLESERRTRSVADAVAQIDLEAIDTMKDKLSAAAGEAMLVRIEMERFEKTIGERSDQLAVRLTEVETTLQDTTLDVAASVQLDRLEEIERALAELDPDQFVRRDGLPTDPTATAPSLDDATSGTEVGDPESLTLASAESILKGDEPRLPGRPTPVGSDADRSDIDAIIAAAEAVNEREV
jgi:chromosome segregation ATPase